MRNHDDVKADRDVKRVEEDQQPLGGVYVGTVVQYAARCAVCDWNGPPWSGDAHAEADCIQHGRTQEHQQRLTALLATRTSDGRKT